jgi:hypothetical protein
VADVPASQKDIVPARVAEILREECISERGFQSLDQDDIAVPVSVVTHAVREKPVHQEACSSESLIHEKPI